MAPPKRGLDVASLWDLEEEVTHGEGARGRQTQCGFCFEEFSHVLFHSHSSKMCFCGPLCFKCSPLSMSTLEFQPKNKDISSLKWLLIPVVGSVPYLSSGHRSVFLAVTLPEAIIWV